MPLLICKRCTNQYRGDGSVARICDPCWNTLIASGWDDGEIIEKYQPTSEEVAATEESEGT
jgi:hypothetical protein